MTLESPAADLSNAGERECRGLLISRIHDDFWSDDYYRSAQAVRAWRDRHGEDFPTALFRLMEHLDVMPEAEREEVVAVNAGRRLIKSYFRKTQQLCVRGFLSEGDLREHLTMPQRLETLFEIIEPFEVARRADYHREMFDFYDALYSGELDRPSR